MKLKIRGGKYTQISLKGSKIEKIQLRVFSNKLRGQNNPR